MTANIFVMNPTASGGNEQAAEPEALDGLKGKVVGFIDNSKPNFDHLITEMAELLESRYAARSIVRRKRLASIPAEDQVIAELAQECDLVITGSGD
jgi:hypothetical protein